MRLCCLVLSLLACGSSLPLSVCCPQRAIGYRAHSPRGSQFRQWATARLKEYLVKGFVLDDERLKNPPDPGVPDYFSAILPQPAP